MESGTIVRWRRRGDQVEKGEALYELDTEKVTQEVEADASGVLLKILAGEGEEIEVGKRIAVIGEAGEEVETKEEPTEVAEGEAQEEGSPGPAREEERERGREPPPTRLPRSRQRRTGPPEGVAACARIARERGIELSSLTGTGPDGRIVAEDVERAATSPAHATVGAAPLEAEVEKLSSLRKTIARRLTEAWQAPAFQISMSADMTRAQELRERLRDEGVTVTDVLTKLCAIALLRHRRLNAHYADDELRIFPNAHVGLAVATERAPRPGAARGRAQVARRVGRRAQGPRRADAPGQALPDDLEGGTFTISNLGMYGVEQFIAVLNPPQVAILAVGAIERRPVWQGDAFVPRPLMSLTLTCDHRAADGAEAAEFLRTVKTLIEEPGLAL